jgi:hypothetical protein
MVRKGILILVSGVILFALDQYWLYPILFGNLPNPFGWIVASTVAIVELSALLAEWIYL